MNLPEIFLTDMKTLLADDFDSYLSSLSEKPKSGMRINRLKISADEFIKLYPDNITKIPYIDNGFLYDNKDNPAKSPFYHAGLYYLQEPSAMLPANRLPIKRGDKVLDLCAAPGGKATELLGKLAGTGFLYANDISYSRALALLKNIELSGAGNVYVTACEPNKLSKYFSEYFDKILCDCPCSGEGMFRKDNSLVKSWLIHGPDYYKPIQMDILEHAYHMLKPGGLMMYSTCTFNVKENEENILSLLEKHSDLSLTSIEGGEGFCEGQLGLKECVRIYPHKTVGEGHFLALIKKEGKNNAPDNTCGNTSGINPVVLKLNGKDGKICEYLLPPLHDNGYREGLRYLRTGLFLNNSQAYAMSLSKEKFNNHISFKSDDVNVIKYLKGETLIIDNSKMLKKGLTLVMCENFPLGFAKYDGTNKLKNLYNKGWRMK